MSMLLLSVAVLFTLSDRYTCALMCLGSAADEAIEQFGHLEPAGVNPLPGLSNGSRLTTEIALRHILSTASVVPRVLCDQPHVETPLLEC